MAKQQAVETSGAPDVGPLLDNRNSMQIETCNYMRAASTTAEERLKQVRSTLARCNASVLHTQR